MAFINNKMFDRLQQKWKVGGWQLLFILLTFAIGGSLTGYVAKKVMNLVAIHQDWLWAIIYILLVVILWPVMVIIISIPFGQSRFFMKYVQKIGAGMGMAKSKVKSQNPIRIGSKKQIAIFASGTGTNAQKIIDHFRAHPFIKVAMIASNNPTAAVLNIAAKENIPSLIIEKEKFFRGNAYVDELKKNRIDFIVLAGFLWKIPVALLKAYPQKIINIHPALLPKYGGKGMYGSKVHEAVLANKEKESGISIHYVDEVYDHGKIIFQAKCSVLETDTPDSLAQRVHALEHEHYPRVIEDLVKRLSVN
jgi:formyltetrahydrofolate-dependent phosphoribosylglycinamide formyltransferase